MKLVTIRTYSFASEMAVARSLLDSEGIETYVQDELISQVNFFYTNAVGGIKLQVEEQDVGKAVDILVGSGLMKIPAEPGISRRVSLELPDNFWRSASRVLIIALLIFLFIYFMSL